MPVGFLDPEPLTFEGLKDGPLSKGRTYLEFGLRKHHDKDFVMFAHNPGQHWIAVVIAIKWRKVYFVDSAPSAKTEMLPLKNLIQQ